MRLFNVSRDYDKILHIMGKGSVRQFYEKWKVKNKKCLCTTATLIDLFKIIIPKYNLIK